MVPLEAVLLVEVPEELMGLATDEAPRERHNVNKSQAFYRI